MSESKVSVQVPLRWGDMDAYGHVNNVQIVRIMEEARIRAFGQPANTGLPGEDAELSVFDDLPEGIQTLVSEHRVKYVSPLNYRTVPCCVELWVSSMKAASLSLAYRIYDGVDGTLCVKASTGLAFFDERVGRLMRMDPEHRAKLAPYLHEASGK